MVQLISNKYINELKNAFKDSVYYDLDKNIQVLKKHYPNWRLLLSCTPRGVGKSTSARRYIQKHYLDVDNPYKFCWLRTSDIAVKQLKNSFLASCGTVEVPSKARDGTYVNKHIPKYLVNGIGEIIQNYGERRIVGLLCSLSTFNNMRSAFYENFSIMIYDEFNQIDVMNATKMSNTWYNFINLMSTLRRDNTEGDNAFRVVILGNKDNTNNFIINNLEIDVEDIYDKLEDQNQIYHWCDGANVVDIYGLRAIKLKSSSEYDWLNLLASKNSATDKMFNQSSFVAEKSWTIRPFRLLSNEIELNNKYILPNNQTVVHYSCTYKCERVEVFTSLSEIQYRGFDVENLTTISLTRQGDAMEYSVEFELDGITDIRELVKIWFKEGYLYFTDFETWQNCLFFLSSASKQTR